MNGTQALNLNALREFAEIAKRGSFRAAARSLGIPLATLSRHIRDLELQLGERLLDRTTRQVQVTARGALLLDAINDPIARIDAAHRAFGGALSATKGPVCIATNSALAQMLVVPAFSSLRARYPLITLELSLDADIVNMRDDSVDFALRAGDIGDEPQVRKKIARHHFVHYVAAGVQDPDALPLVAYDSNEPGADRAVLFVKDGLLQREMVVNGLATGWGADALAIGDEKAGRLRRLENTRAHGFDVFVCYPDRGHLTPRARLVMDQITRHAQHAQVELERMLPPIEA